MERYQFSKQYDNTDFQLVYWYGLIRGTMWKNQRPSKTPQHSSRVQSKDDLDRNIQTQISLYSTGLKRIYWCIGLTPYPSYLLSHYRVIECNIFLELNVIPPNVCHPIHFLIALLQHITCQDSLH